jgi:hypothetical protein
VVPSVKNFRLGLTLPSAHGARAAVRAACCGGEPKEALDAATAVPLLTLTKLGKDTFECTFSQPFSAVQAFGVALSRFDTKQVQ